nr:NAD-dependent DNA ligase LigA [Glycomyces paridis]
MTTIPTAHAVALADEAAYLDAVARARTAADAYYGSGESGMDDDAYDRLVRGIAAWEEAHPDAVAPDSPTREVAAGVTTGEVEHVARMLSLGNVFSDEELTEWAASVERRLGGRPVEAWAVEPKLDGVALAARYRDGALVQLVTRGDGSTGEDVSHTIGHVDGLPLKLTEPVTVEVRGEVLMTEAQFADANRMRVEHGGQAFANRRNASSGSLRAKDRPYQVEQTFLAYDALTDPEHTSEPGLDALTHTGLIERLGELGLGTTAGTPVATRACATLADVLARVHEIGALRAGLPFELDGAVVKADERADRAAAGEGSRSPHWATAYKFPAAQKITVLRDVEWSVGRTGVVAPRAVLEPVAVGGTTITYATLHNPADITRRGLMIGDHVTVYRAGEVIPRVEGAVASLRTGEERPIAFPEQCPRCGADIDRTQERWRCVRGRACGRVEAIGYAVARDCLDIDGLGEKIVVQLVERGLIEDFADLFSLTKEQFLTLDRMGDKSADNLVAAIDRARSKPLNRVFCALGVLGTGRSMSLRIATALGSMRAVQEADAAALERVDGIGGEKAPVIVAELAELAPVIDKLVAAGVNMDQPGYVPPAPEDLDLQEAAQDPSDLPLADRTVVVTGGMTGPLESYSRNEMNELIARAGGRASSSVSKRTGLVVAGANAGSKLEKAQTLGIPTSTPEEFAELVADYLSLQRRPGVHHQLLELGLEPRARGRRVRQGPEFRGADRAEAPVVVGVGPVGLAGRLDPDVGVQPGISYRVGLRPLAEPGPDLVAAVLLVLAAVDPGLVHVDVRIGAGARPGRPVRAAPAVAGGVHDDAEVGCEALGHEAVAEVERERGFVHVTPEVDPERLRHRHSGDDVVGVEVRFLQGAVVCGVHRDALDVAGFGAVVEDRGVQPGGVAEGVVERGRVGPSEEAVAPRVDVVVDARVGQRRDRVGDALLIGAQCQDLVALRRPAGVRADVVGQVGQREGLDHGGDAQVGVFGPGDDRGDRVDELVPVSVDLVGRELAV